jgi:outer membrane lipoprotein carrier protein
MTNNVGQRRTVLGWGGGTLLAVAVWVLALPAQADSVDVLAQFMKQARSGRADFTQVVTSPSRPGQTPRAKPSSGRFEFQRPGKFRFDYRKPFVQTLVADGQTLWLHDVDLNQVTARAQSQVLGSTPAALLTAASTAVQVPRECPLRNGRGYPPPLAVVVRFASASHATAVCGDLLCGR